MREILFVGWLFFLVIPLPNLRAQVPGDSLELAKTLRTEGKLEEALRILKQVHNAHPTDLNATWLYAQTAYWNKQISLSRALYESAVTQNPDRYDLQLDYARMLFGSGFPALAESYFMACRVAYPNDVEIELTLAQLALWKGAYQQSLDQARRILERDPDNKEAASLLRQASLAKAPIISFAGSYYTDNQPLETINPLLESMIWLDPLSTLRFSLRTPLFSPGNGWKNALWLQAGNQAFWWRGNWKLTTDAGILMYPYKNTITWTGNLELEKKSFRHLVFRIQAERKPYFSTGSSIDTVVNEYNANAEIGWDDYNSWNGKLSISLDHFIADGNTLYSIGGWGVTPPLKTWVFDFRLGYGISYSTSRENRYVAKENLNDILSGYNTETGIEGIYYPYFTPNHQWVNSAILSIGIHPARSLDLGVTGNLGFYATADIPYLYLDTVNTGGYQVVRDFSLERYIPYTISAFINWKLSDHVTIRFDYIYGSTYFYTNQQLMLKLQFSLGRKINPDSHF